MDATGIYAHPVFDYAGFRYRTSLSVDAESVLPRDKNP